MADFVKLSKVGQRLILANGRDISIVKYTREETGARHRGRDKTKDTSIDTVGAFTSYSKSKVDGTIIKMGDKQLLVSAEGLTEDLEEFDAVQDGLKKWKIVNVDVIQPADVIVLYKLQVRR